MVHHAGCHALPDLSFCNQQLPNYTISLLYTFLPRKARTLEQDLENENVNLKDIIAKLRRSLVSIDGEVELYKKQLEEREKQIQNGYR